MRNKLMGELIGIARAVMGNEHLIHDSTMPFIQQALCCSEPDPDMLQLARDEKRKLVPNCITCGNPCGRTDAYDLGRLEREVPQIRDLKQQILAKLADSARSWNADKQPVILLALFAVGLEGVSADYYADVLSKLDA